MIGTAPICIDCKHYHKDAEKITCDAFPKGIPDEILFGDFDHHKPHPDDNGIRFEANPNERNQTDR